MYIRVCARLRALVRARACVRAREGGGGGARVRACVRARVRVRVCAYVRARVRVRVCTGASNPPKKKFTLRVASLQRAPYHSCVLLMAR